MTRAPQGAQAVLRAVAILKAFSEERPELSLSELSRHLELTRTTTHRLLAALESEGLVERTSAGGGFRLGPAAISLGHRALRTSDLRARIRPVLVGLAGQTGETATLEVLLDTDMLILDGVAGRHLVGASAEVGTRWPMHATSTGKAVLGAHALADSRYAHSLLETSLRRAARLDELDARWQEVQEVASRGWAEACEELEPGFVAVGAALGVNPEGVQGALSIGGPLTRLDGGRRRELGEMMKKAAGELRE